MVWNRKIAYINLSTGKVEQKLIPRDMRTLYLGGRGIDMYLLYNHIKPGCDPLGPDNVLAISAGLLGGTTAPSSSRTARPTLNRNALSSIRCGSVCHAAGISIASRPIRHTQRCWSAIRPWAPSFTRSTPKRRPPTMRASWSVGPPAPHHRRDHGRHQLVVVPRLLDVVACTPAHRFNRPGQDG